MNKFNGNSNERIIELYRERISGIEHEYMSKMSNKWCKCNGDFHYDLEYRKVKNQTIVYVPIDLHGNYLYSHTSENLFIVQKMLDNCELSGYMTLKQITNKE